MPSDVALEPVESAAIAMSSSGSGLQRAVGELAIAAKRFGDATVIDNLRQAGCLKARFPKPQSAGWLEPVMLNTGGGVAGGDRLDIRIDAAPGTRMTVAAQAAERFYRALAQDRPSQVRSTLSVSAGAVLEWLPQETILFDRSALDRRLSVDLSEDAVFLGVETLVFGRAAMGEVVRQAWLRDLIRVRRDGRLLLHDPIRLDGQVESQLAQPALGGGASVVATVIQAGGAVEASLMLVREALDAIALPSIEAGVSAWNGILVARLVGRDSAMMRRAVIAALTVLRGSRPLPRVWLC